MLAKWGNITKAALHLTEKDGLPPCSAKEKQIKAAQQLFAKTPDKDLSAPAAPSTASNAEMNHGHWIPPLACSYSFWPYCEQAFCLVEELHLCIKSENTGCCIHHVIITELL